MTKLFKKSLALMLTLAICLSAMACCFIVSAEDETTPAGSISFVLADGTTEINPGDDVIIDVVANWSGVAGAEFTVTGIPAEATVATTNTEVVINHDAAAATVKFVDGNNGELANGVLFSISFTAGEAATLYNLAFADNSVFCNLNEEDVTVTCVPNSFEVVEKVVEPEEPAEPVVDPALTFRGASLGYGKSSLQINFRVLNTVLALYDDMEIVIIPQKYNKADLNLVETPAEIVIKKADLAAAGTTMMSYLYTDIYLYELGLNIDYMLRAYDAEDNLVAVSEVFTTSAASYLKTLFASSTNAKFRTLITDTLVVGDKGAKNMAKDYVGSDLYNAPSIIEGFDISEATPSVDSYNTVDIFNSNNADFGSTSAFKHQVRKSVSIGKVPFVTYRIKDSGSALDLSKLSVNVTYGDNYNVTFTTATNPEAFSVASGWINFKFDQVGLQDGDKNLVATFSYDGEVVCDSTYSVETYLGAAMSNATIGELATSLIKLGISFRAYQAG